MDQRKTECLSLIFGRRRLGRHAEFCFVIGIPRQILCVVKRDVEHESDQEKSASALNNLKNAEIDRSTADSFDQGQYNMPTIQDGNWQKVDHGEVYVEDHAKPERKLPPEIAVKQTIVGLHDHDRAAHVLKLDIGLR